MEITLDGWLTAGAFYSKLVAKFLFQQTAGMRSRDPLSPTVSKPSDEMSIKSETENTLSLHKGIVYVLCKWRQSFLAALRATGPVYIMLYTLFKYMMTAKTPRPREQRGSEERRCGSEEQMVRCDFTASLAYGFW